MKSALTPESFEFCANRRWKVKVTGVEYVDKSGKKHVIEATLSVVAAAGGFGANPQMRALHDPRMLNLTTTNQPGATGDLIPLLQDIGAELTGMDFIQCNPGCPPGRSHRIIMHLIVRNFIMVDLSGKRLSLKIPAATSSVMQSSHCQDRLFYH